MSNDRQPRIRKIDRPMRGPPGAGRGYEKPQDVQKVVVRLLSYLGRHRLALLAVFVMVLLYGRCHDPANAYAVAAHYDGSFPTVLA